ncbi:cupin domain-containing protein [Bdellovibrio bacteriovorus]|uniref:cupin domain-containing protein n=1 Tax=Bdellovibrio TaxID=958 RepID=UPI0035A8621A
MMKAVVLLVLAVSSSSAFAVDEPDHIMLKPQEIKWQDAPAALPPGAKTAVLYGDPSTSGPFSMRIKMPAKYLIPPHFHPQDENVTVISGTLMMGIGDDAKNKAMALPAGSFARMKTGTHHFAKADKETVVQLNGMGPWGITYINPADDPRSKKINP